MEKCIHTDTHTDSRLDVKLFLFTVKADKFANFGCPLLAQIGNLILIQSNVENGSPHILQI